MAFTSTGAHAAFGFKLDGTLDKEAISHAYFEGDFARVLPPLEMVRQTFPASSTREDSIFVYKYLSVIYAADTTTRAKAESYMSSSKSRLWWMAGGVGAAAVAATTFYVLNDREASGPSTTIKP